MKTSTSQLYMAAINLLAASTVKGEEVTREDILWAIDLATRTAEEISDGDNIPSDDEVKNYVRKAFDTLNKPSTKTSIVNAILLRGKVRRNEAEYMVARAESIGFIEPKQNGNRVDYTLA